MIPSAHVLQAAAAAAGSSFQVLHSLFHIFAKCPCRWEDDEVRGVVFTDGAEKCKQIKEGRKVGCLWVIVQRGQRWNKQTHTPVFLSFTPHAHPQRLDSFFERAVLELYSRPCAPSSPTPWRDGGQSQIFPLECQRFLCRA